MDQISLSGICIYLTQGTQVYNATKGAFVDLGMLDVLQIFGRAGRPQFDSYGEGVIITTHDRLAHYLSLLTRQQPIESQLVESLTDNLNAEVSQSRDTRMTVVGTARCRRLWASLGSLTNSTIFFSLHMQHFRTCTHVHLLYTCVHT